MTPIKRPLAVLGATALLSLGLTACGGYPTDASAKDFCSGLADLGAVTLAVKDPDDPTKKEWDKIKDEYEKFGETGTPENIEDDEREGFEILVDAITDLDYDEAKKSFGSADGDDSIPGISKKDEKKVDKFSEYASEECDESSEE